MLLLVGSGCSKFRKVQKSDDWRVKYEAAKEYYDKEDYYKASILLEELTPIVKGSAEAETVQFLYAYAHYHRKLFVESAFYFKTFYETFSRSEQAQEAMYMRAYSLYMDSPSASLDQASTYEAIQAFQSFINKFPYSEYAEQTNEIIDALQVKLETKAYQNAKLYYQLNRLKAAIVAINSFENEYPDSDYNEELGYLKIETQYTYAKESIETVQRERYQQVMEFYEEFIDRYPDSKYLRTAQNYYSTSINEAEKLATKNLPANTESDTPEYNEYSDPTLDVLGNQQ